MNFVNVFYTLKKFVKKSIEKEELDFENGILIHQ